MLVARNVRHARRPVMGCCGRKREQFEIDVSAPGTYSIISALLFPRMPYLDNVPVSGDPFTRASAADSTSQGRAEPTIIAANSDRSNCGARSARGGILHDRPDHFALPNHRKARCWRHGCRLKGRRHLLGLLCRLEVSPRSSIRGQPCN